MFHRLFAYHLAALVLLTNVGIPVFTHVCHAQGKAWSAVLMNARSCCSKKKAASQVVDCHVAYPDSKAGIKHKSCCENHTTLLKTASEFINLLSIKAAKTLQQGFDGPLAVVEVPCISLHSIASTAFQPHAPPIPLHGRSLLVFKQVFRC